MPMKWERYPLDWPQISRAVREAAGWRCESCGVVQGEQRINIKGQPYREIMTCAHLGIAYPDGRDGDPGDKMDCRPENLACLCTRCHLDYDRPENVRQRIITLHLRKVEQLRQLYGAGALFEEHYEGELVS